MWLSPDNIRISKCGWTMLANNKMLSPLRKHQCVYHIYLNACFKFNVIKGVGEFHTVVQRNAFLVLKKNQQIYVADGACNMAFMMERSDLTSPCMR